MARQNTISTKFIADGKDLLNVLDDINNKLDGLSKTSSKNFAANFVQSAEIVINKLKQLGAQLIEIGERGTGFALLQQEFDGLTSSLGQSSDRILSSLKDTSSGAISERNLILSTNRAILLNVADTEEELNKLLEISISRANKLGVSATQAFNDIVTGIGRESALILDNLGIIVKLEQATEKYAATLGKSVESLTAVERKQAIVNAVFAQSEGMLKSSKTEAELNAAKVSSLTAAWENFADTFSARVSPGLAEAASKIADLLKQATDLTNYLANNAAVNPFETLIAGIQNASGGDLSTQINKSFANNFVFDDASYSALINAFDSVGQESISASELISILNKEITKLEISSKSAGPAVVQMGTDMIDAAENAASLAAFQAEVTRENQLFEAQNKNTAGSLSALATATAYSADALNMFENKLMSAQRANAQFESSVGGLTNTIVQSAVKIQRIAGADLAKSLGVDALNRLNIEAAKLQPSIANGEVSALDLALTFGRIEDDLLSPFQKLEEENRLAEQALKNTGVAGVSAAKSINSEFEALKGKISGVLSSALSDDLGGIDLEAILGRPDSVAEDARRLADVAVNGFSSQWLPYLQDKFPQLFEAATDGGDIKQLAANILKDFQDGLVPELIDRETAKERVRRALIGEQNLASLANEIASELATEFGTSLGQVQSIANNVLGVGGGSAGGLTLPSPTLNTDSINALPGQFESSFESTFDGLSEKFATLITDTFSAKVVLESSATAGRQNGQSWGTGFLETVNDNVPPQLIDILTLAVLPRVENALKNSENQEAAR